MLYKLIYMFHADYSFLNVFRYITFRTIYATLTALVISLVLGYWLIPRVRELQIGQYVRDDVGDLYIALRCGVFSALG